MSRFFETLKEASRTQVRPNEPASDTPAGPPAAPDLIDFPIAPIAGPGPSAEAVPPLPPLPPLSSPLPPLPPLSQAEFLNGAMAPPHGIQGKPINVVLDKKVPLIPHTLDNSIVEQYRRLRTKIQQQHATQPIHSLLVASPGPGEGKTVTVINLALSFAMLSSTRVLVIDGDLRKGTVGKWLGVKDMPGFSNVIEGSARVEDAIFKSEELPLHFMFSGTSKRSSAELLNSQVVPETIRRLTRDFDLVLVDSPPVNLIADAQMLAGSCDGVLLVARAFKTTGKAFQKMLKDLVPFRIVGTVVNGGMRAQVYNRYYSTY